MAGETTNPGYIDASSYASSPSGTAPDQTHQEYGRGINSYNLEQAGEAAKLASVIDVDTVSSPSRVGVGTDTPLEQLHVSNTSGSSAIAVRSSTGGTAEISFGDSDDHNIGQIQYQNASDAMLFKTNTSEASRINSGGNFLVAKTADGGGTTGFEARSDGLTRITRDGGQVLEINRLTDDGVLIDFAQDNVSEGDISVSGTTVSLNGAHLARWSQLTSGTPDSLLRGTVMSNLDEMCVWNREAKPAILWTQEDIDAGYAPEGTVAGDERYPAVPAGVEDNEQLNKTKVSDVAGDKDVAGVFSHLDTSDDLDDFYIAQSGDFVIRIAQGTTVARGDLLESAGDGTAKPQADDIVYSKTIAKVTSTNVSVTHPDGSYCVPCVLMVC